MGNYSIATFLDNFVKPEIKIGNLSKSLAIDGI